MATEKGIVQSKDSRMSPGQDPHANLGNVTFKNIFSKSLVNQYSQKWLAS